MGRITDKPETPAERAAAAQVPSEISVSQKKKRAKAQAEADANKPGPDYVVSVTKREKDAKVDDHGVPKQGLVYSSKELRERAAALLKNDKLPNDQKRVLADILDEKGEQVRPRDKDPDHPKG